MDRFSRINFYSTMAMDVGAFQQDLFMSGKNTSCITTVKKQLADAKTLDENCLIIAVIPKLIESVEMLDVLKAVKKSGVQIPVISAAILSQYEKYADYIKPNKYFT